VIYNNYIVDLIIPIFNGQEFLDDLISNIAWVFENEFKNLINVILVDDGSTDNTSLILKKFDNFNYKNLKIISQNNQGEGAARNTGIKNSNSPFILFLDCDDQLLNSGLKKFIKGYEKYKYIDIFIGSYYVQSLNNKISRCRNPDLVLINNSIAENFFNRKIYFGIGNTIISRKIIYSNQIIFKNYETGCDNNFFRNYALYAEKLVSISDYFFIYKKNSNSVTHISSTKHWDVIKSIDDTRNSITKIKKYNKKIKKRLNKALNYFLIQDILGLAIRGIVNKNAALRSISLQYIEELPLDIDFKDFISRVRPFRRLLLLIFNFSPKIFLFVINYKEKRK